MPKLTDKDYRKAARAVIIAVREHRNDPSTSNRRKHVKQYKRHAAKALGMASVYPARWNQVLKQGERAGYFKVDSHSLSKPVFVDLNHPRTMDDQEEPPTPERVRLDLGLSGAGESLRLETGRPYSEPVEPTEDEDTSDEPTVQHAQQAHTHGAILYRQKVPSNAPWFTDGVFKLDSPRLMKRFERWNKNSAYDAVISYFTPR